MHGIRHKPEKRRKFLYYLFLDREVSIRPQQRADSQPAATQAIYHARQNLADKRAHQRDSTCICPAIRKSPRAIRPLKSLRAGVGLGKVETHAVALHKLKKGNKTYVQTLFALADPTDRTTHGGAVPGIDAHHRQPCCADERADNSGASGTIT